MAAVGGREFFVNAESGDEDDSVSDCVSIISVYCGAKGGDE